MHFKTYHRKDWTRAVLPPHKAGSPEPRFDSSPGELWRWRDGSGRSDRRNHRLRGWAIHRARGDLIAGTGGAGIRRARKYGAEHKRGVQRRAGWGLFEHDSGEDGPAGDGIIHLDPGKSGGTAGGDRFGSDQLRSRRRLFGCGHRFRYRARVHHQRNAEPGRRFPRCRRPMDGYPARRAPRRRFLSQPGPRRQLYRGSTHGFQHHR